MTALYHRKKTGRGQFIDLALSEGTICQIGEYIAAHSRTGIQPPRTGNSHPDHAPYGVYPAFGDDEWVAVCVTSDEQWQALCQAHWESGACERSQVRGTVGAAPEQHRWPMRLSQDGRRLSDGAATAAALQDAVSIAAGRVGNNRQVLGGPAPE